MDARLILEAAAKVIGRPLTAAEKLDMSAKIDHHALALRRERPDLEGLALQKEVAKRAAADIVGEQRARADRLKQRILDAEFSPNPLKWNARDRLGLAACILLFGLLALVAGYMLERRGYYTLVEWLTDSASFLVWLGVGAGIGGAGFFALRFGRVR